MRRRLSIYWGFAAMVPKLFAAYSIWVWMNFIVQCISLVIFVAFWTAVYAEQETIGGLRLDQTLNYIILAQILLPLAHETSTIFHFGRLLREGQLGIELLRPLDFQAATYVTGLGFLGVNLLMQIPLAVVGWFFFHYQLPTDPFVWLAFLISLMLGNAVMFLFDWMLACAAFFSTEVWGLGVLRFALGVFFSGSLIPLVMMPDWLRTIATVLPFSQALYVPVGILSGILPAAEAPRLWAGQIAAIVVLFFVSRAVFSVSVRKVTVQGG